MDWQLLRLTFPKGNIHRSFTPYTMGIKINVVGCGPRLKNGWNNYRTGFLPGSSMSPSPACIVASSISASACLEFVGLWTSVALQFV